jgi:hypothetical protein
MTIKSKNHGHRALTDQCQPHHHRMKTDGDEITQQPPLLPSTPMDFVKSQLDAASNIDYKIIKKMLNKTTINIIEISMPDGASKLLYSELPSTIRKNRSLYEMDTSMGIYHEIKPSASYALQPRKTVCYSHAYNYSKTVHPVEAETPKHIRKLYRVTNKLFSLEEGVNMDLVNYYPTGRHYINAHSDDERQFGNL